MSTSGQLIATTDALALPEQIGQLLGLNTDFIPAALTGEHGDYRLPGLNQVGAHCTNDLHMINYWLDLSRQRTGSQATVSNYRKEIVRLMRWAFRRNKALSSISASDARAYLDYLAAPDPVDIGNTKVSLSHPDWRPFAGPLQPSSQSAARKALSSFYNCAVNHEYCRINPFKIAVGVKAAKRASVERFLSDAAMAWLFKLVDAITTESPWADHRRRWVVHSLFGLGIRRKEAQLASMADIRQFKGKTDTPFWTLTVTGKGGKPRHIPIPPATLDALAAYRIASGLPPLPIAGFSKEPFYATRTGSAMTSSRLHQIVKDAMREASNLALETDPASAQELSQASAHWFRHALATSLTNAGNPLQAVAKILGHDDISTTAIYLHADMEQMANIMAQHKPPERS